MQKFTLHFKESDIARTAKQFIQLAGNRKHFAFRGEMGAGKTTFIKAICLLLGTNDLVSSPTFSIVNEYFDNQGGPIYHFDFYRIKNSAELFDIGFEEYCKSESYCFIEWPEKAEECIPDDFINVEIQEEKAAARKLSFYL